MRLPCCASTSIRIRTYLSECTYLNLSVRTNTLVSTRKHFSKYVVLSGDFSCSLYKLQLKFEETTRVVCTDFAEVLSLGSACLIFSSFVSDFHSPKRPFLSTYFVVGISLNVLVIIAFYCSK